jgi:hypothetical protein
VLAEDRWTNVAVLGLARRQLDLGLDDVLVRDDAQQVADRVQACPPLVVRRDRCWSCWLFGIDRSVARTEDVGDRGRYL